MMKYTASQVVTGRRSPVSLLLLTGLLMSLWTASASAQPASRDEAAGRNPAAKPAANADEGPAPVEAEEKNPFPGRVAAPSLEGGSEWFNTKSEISLKELRGKIVILDFWTYCCINCIHVLPDLKYLEEKYPNELVVIGVHAAKFDNEKLSANIREAVLRYEISHPVVNDSEMTIARKYAFNSWPTLVLIDPEGQFVGRASGEGNRELLDDVIGRMAAYHKKKGTLDETPIRFDLERDTIAPGPLKYPGKILADEASNRLFISDSNHNRIVISTLDGKLLEVIGTGNIGRADGAYDAAEFDHPQGMALVDEMLYVADTENHLLRVIDLKKKVVSTLAGTGFQSRSRYALNHPVFESGGPLKTTPLNSPWALTHRDGVLYIAMAGPHQMWFHKIGSDAIEVFAGSGREDILDGPRDTAALAQPSGITHDGTDLYITDSEGSAIRRVTLGPKGSVTTLVGPHDFPNGRSLFEFDDIDGKGDEVRLQHPLEVLYHDQTLFVADTYNHKIKQIDIKGATCKTWLGTGQRGTAIIPKPMLSEPAGLTIANGLLFIADTNNHRILTADLKTKETKLFTVAGLQPPSPPKRTVDEGLQLVVTELPQQTIRGGDGVTLKLDFQLPEGFKLNTLAKVLVTVTAVGDQTLVADDSLDVKHSAEHKGETLAEWTLPVSGTGAGVYDITVSYQYCRDGAGGVCRFGRQKFRLPLTAAADAKNNEVRLEVGE